MSDERIDIEINDKIDGNIPKKLKDIAAGADKSASSVQKLKAELAGMSDTPAKKLKAATDEVSNAVNKELNAQRGLKTAVDQTTSAMNKEVAAQDRISKMIDRSIAKYEAQRKAAQAAYAASVGRSSGVGAATQAVGIGAAGAAAEGAAVGAGIKAAATETEAAVAAMETATVPRLQRFKLAALGAFDSVRDAVTRNGTRFTGVLGAGGAAAVEKEAGAVVKLGHAAAGNSTAIRELFVLAREGGRGDFTRMAGSVSILAGSLGLMNTVLIPAALLLGTAAAAMKLFQMNTRDEANSQLKAYSNTLGLTHKEMRKLSNETVGAEGKLKEFDATQLTMGDTFHGFVATVKDGLKGFGSDAKAEIDKMGINWAGTWHSALDILRDVFVGFYGLVHGLIDWVIGTIKNAVTIVGNLCTAIGNAVTLAIQAVINTGISGINLLIAGASAIMTKLGFEAIKPIEKVNLGVKSLTDNMKELVGVDVGGSAKRHLNEVDRTLTGFNKKWKREQLEAAKERVNGLADAIKNNRNPKHEPNPKTKDDYLNDTNKKLDDELSRMHMLKDAREEQQRLDQIEEEFAKRRQPLTATEIAGFKAKIHAIEEYKYIQSELDRIYEEAVTPQRTYNATIAAATDLLGRGAISAARFALESGNASRKLAESKDLTGATAALREYNQALDNIKYSLSEHGISSDQAAQETVKATRAYQQASNPLFDLKEALDTATVASRLYGLEVQRGAYYEQIRQAYLAKGIVLSQSYVAGVNAEVDALIKKNNALSLQQQVQSTVGGIVNPLLENRNLLDNKAAYYAELDRLRQKDFAHEKEYAQAKHALDAKFTEMRLQGASAMFGELASLSSSGNKKLAAIGKAAAIAQATIDGFVAVQKALASAPPPFNFLMAGAVAIKTGAQVAGIVSTNVGGFQTGGQFMVDGKSGVDQNNINMNVSRGERVTIETPAQQRANDNNKPGAASNHSTKIVNILDPSMIHEALQSEAGEHILFNFIGNNPSRINGMLGNGKQ